MSSTKLDLYSLSLDQLEKLVTDELNEPSFRAEQISNWLYQHQVTEIDQMTNLSENLRSDLKELAYIKRLKEVTRAEAEDGTIKFLFELVDGCRIETVFLPYQSGRNSICVSTQVGCAMGCNFCATGQQGLERNLSSGEIINQLLTVQQIINQEGISEGAITNLVFMGMGEPLANYDNLLTSLEILNSDQGLNISLRRITVSTCGLVPQIKQLADEKLQLVLAISLHAANDQLRNEMMPVNERYSLTDLISACEYYVSQTKRRITFEYALVDGVNNSLEDAKQLAELLSGLLCHVNLIPINPVSELNLRRPNRADIKRFEAKLSEYNIPVTVRQERGSDIEAACGQLRTQNSEDRS
ncbi:MAG: 23S rRNA (adenine(2503)-C(2))-methyltransferase RlmN [Bacillota bacterium]